MFYRIEFLSCFISSLSLNVANSRPYWSILYTNAPSSRKKAGWSSETSACLMHEHRLLKGSIRNNVHEHHMIVFDCSNSHIYLTMPIQVSLDSELCDRIIILPFILPWLTWAILSPWEECRNVSQHIGGWYSGPQVEIESYWLREQLTPDVEYNDFTPFNA